MSRSKRAIPVIIVAFLVGAGLQSVRATDVCGDVCDVTWTAAGSPYILTCDVNVSVGCTLTVDSGVEVLSDPGFGLWVSGTLDVNGTSGSRVRFDSGSGLRDWDGIAIQGTATSTLDYADIHNADKGVWVAGNAIANLANVEATDNLHALYVEGHGSPTLNATDCEFAFNGAVTGESAIDVRGTEGNPNPSVSITHSSIHGNLGDHDVQTSNFDDPRNSPLFFRDNWWGTTDAEAIDARIVDDDEWREAVVDWCGFLDAPGGSRFQDGYCPDLLVCDRTEIWDQTDRPYLLVANHVTVCPTGTLQIDAGVEVRARPGNRGGITVYGTFDVNGTEPSPVVFTSDSGTPQPEDWQGLVLGEGCTSTIDYATITYAEDGIRTDDESNVTLHGVTASENDRGLDIHVGYNVGNNTSLVATACTFTDNAGLGVLFSQDPIAHHTPVVSITGSSIHSNLGDRDFAAANANPGEARTVIHARGNWWGSTDSTTIASRIGDASDNPVSSFIVDWCGYLDDAPPVGSPARDVNCPDLQTCDETNIWDDTTAPYLLVSDVYVCDTGTLRIEAGVEALAVVTDGPMEFEIRGALDVNGTLASPVTLTPDSTTPLAGDWGGVRIVGEDSSGELHHTTITYADEGVYAAASPSVVLNQVTAQWGNLGLHVRGTTSGQPTTSVTASGCTFIENQLHGVMVERNRDVDPVVTISESSIHSNLGTYDYYVEPDFLNPWQALRARGNWWGSDDTSVIAQRIHDRSDNSGSARVDWCAWLDGPGGAAPDVTCPDSTEICDRTATWTYTGLPYFLTDDVHVCPTGTLVIDPGVEVHLVTTSPRVRFDVEGVLDVNGTPGAPVLVTSSSDPGQARNWQGLYLSAGSTTDLEHVTIEYADIGIQATGSAQVSLNTVTVARNRRGLHVFGTGPPTVTATGSTFSENSEYGVYLDGNPNPNVTITNSSLHGNLGSYDLFTSSYYSPSTTVVPMRDNWWGTTDAEAIGARIYSRRRNGVCPFVDYCGYLDGPPPGGVRARNVHCPDLVACDSPVTWDLTDRPYQIVTDVRVCNGQTLTIGPGVQTRMVDTYPQPDFLVQGTLDVNGSGGAPVLMTSDSSSPAAQDWRGLYLATGSTSDLEHATIEYANYGIEATGDSQVSLDGVTLARNRRGLHVFGTGPPTVTATGSTFTENSDYGVYLDGNPNPDVTITNSSLHGNLGAYDLFTSSYYSPSTTVLSMRDNWWGTTDAEAIGGRIYGRRRNGVNPFVDYCGYLDGPPPAGARARDVHCPDLVACDSPVTWDLTDRPYQIVTDVRVCNGQTLTIGPGVQTRMVDTYPQPDFLVQGTLDVNGAEGAPVLMTADKAAPAAQDWRGLYLTTGSTSDLAHATIEYANYGIQATGNAQVFLNGVVLSRNRRGLHVFGTGPPTVTATGSTFTENSDYGVYLDGNPNPDVTITNSGLYGNLGAYDLYTSSYANPATTVLSMRDNWWGTADAEAIGSRIYSRRRNGVNPFVDYCGYLDGPPPTGVRARDVHCPDLVACDSPVTWDLTDRPYQIVTDVRVCNGQTLTIGPGVETRMVDTYPQPDFLVQGTLDVNGAEGIPVLMTADKESPAAQDWRGLYLATGSTSDLEHATIEYANYGIEATGDAQVSLDGVILARNRRGLHVFGTGPPTVTATGSTFTENSDYGVYLDGNPNPDVTIANSGLYDNLGAYDLYTSSYASASTTVLSMRDNWWGTTDAEAIGARIYGRRRNSVNPFVDYCHYLDGPPPEGVHARDVHCPDLIACDSPVTWDLTDRPYQIVTDVRVCNGQSLTIGPGVETRMVDTYPQPDFLVQGTLDVNGTESTPVLMTSDATSPAAQDWTGLYLTTGSTSDLQHATIEYANFGIEATGDSQVSLGGVTLARNRRGLHVFGTGPPTVTATGSTFTENSDYGVYLDGNPNPDVTITNSGLYGNLGAHDLFTSSYADPANTVVWATDNWWGTTDEAQIEDRIYDYDDNAVSAHVYYQAFGDDCEMALGRDGDGDGVPDFGDNCPDLSSGSQADTDADGMGDPCDPEPDTAPASACDGFQDVVDGWIDTDGDGWGDPCDHQPTRADSYPGAPELCDGRDNDGDALLASGELADEDLDLGLACGDCDDLEPLANVCGCEACANSIDDDCDLATDGADTDCQAYPTCIVLASGADPDLAMHKGECGGATLSGPFDVIRGEVEQLQIVGGQVDLGTVSCVEGSLDWDRVTDYSLNPNPRCVEMPLLYFVARNEGDPDFGLASDGEPRDLMDPDPPCP
jgi:hypothetical protein